MRTNASKASVSTGDTGEGAAREIVTGRPLYALACAYDPGCRTARKARQGSRCGSSIRSALAVVRSYRAEREDGGLFVQAQQGGLGRSLYGGSGCSGSEHVLVLGLLHDWRHAAMRSPYVTCHPSLEICLYTNVIELTTRQGDSTYIESCSSPWHLMALPLLRGWDDHRPPFISVSKDKVLVYSTCAISLLVDSRPQAKPS